MIMQKLIQSNKTLKKGDANVRFGLRLKFILAFLTFVILPFSVLGIVVYKQSSKIIETNVSLFTLEAIQQISKNIDYYLKEMVQITDFATTDEELLTYLEDFNSMADIEKYEASYKINKKLITFSGLRSDLSGLYLFDTYNNFYFTRGRSPKLGYDYTSEKWYKDSLSKSGSINIIGTHLQYHVQNKPVYVISVSRIIRNFESHKSLGAILVDFDYKLLDKIMSSDSSNAFSKGDLYVLDKDGSIIFNQNSNLLTKKIQYTFNTTIEATEHGTFTETIDGKKMFVVFYTSPYSSWKIVNITPLNYILKDITIIKNSIIIIMTISIILVFISSIEVSYKLVKPIRTLVGAMADMENGHLSRRIQIKTKDEVGLLAESFNSMSQNITNLIEKVYNAQLKQKEAELYALQSQINPHFLYNTLESIRGVAITNGITSIAIMSKSLSNLFRYSIKGKDIVTINDELEYVKNYITIQNFRFEDKFIVTYNVDPSLIDYSILKLTLQPLVENAIHHGLETKAGYGKIDISCEKIQDILSIKITDDGVGISEDKVIIMNVSLQKNIKFEQSDAYSKNESKGIGITNVNTRIKLYFGDEYGLKYTSQKGNGTTVELTIPAIGGEIRI